MEKCITLAHGAGGRQTEELIRKLFRPYFQNPEFTADDAAILHIEEGRLAMTTDGFVVSPCEFNGGDIGKLSICGTVNDLACMGARPLYLTCSFIIEEGFALDTLERIVRSMAEIAGEAGVRIVAGDTKVVGKGQADGVYITTTGIGACISECNISGSLAKAGDAVIVTRDIGRHGCTILLEREQLGIEADIKSDCAPLWVCVEKMLKVSKDIHVIRDATRGGVGTVLYEIARESGVGICLLERDIPVCGEVRGVCGLLGLDPLFLANEGTMVVIVPQEDAGKVLNALQEVPVSQNARIIGKVVEDLPGKITMVTELGTEVMLPQPEGELLPRIC